MTLNLVSVSADGSKGVKRFWTANTETTLARFSIRRWIEGCEAIHRKITNGKLASFSIRRWIEGCEAAWRKFRGYWRRRVSVSADGSKGVKLPSLNFHRFPILIVSVSADGSKGVKPCVSSRYCPRCRWFQYPQMDRRV